MAFVMVFVATVGAQNPEPSLRVFAQARPTVAYVGQPVDLAVGVVAGRERPRLSPPRLVGAELDYLRTELVPMNLSAIGNMISDQNLYRSRFRLIPRTTGPLTIPPFVAILGESRGNSPPVRLTIKPLPSVGRPPWFLGGVGPFEIEAKAEPSSCRVGEAITYTITVTGPGARGINTSPDLSARAPTATRTEIARLSDLVIVEPPTRRFVYRVRPIQPGEVIMPPVSVAAFDPSTEVYVSKVAAGVKIRVTEPPPFDPSIVAYNQSPSTSDSPRGEQWTWWALPIVLTGIVLWLAWRRRFGAQGRVLRRAMAHQIRLLERMNSDQDIGRFINEGLVEYLRLAIDRPAGALTPDEAALGVSLATRLEELGKEARELVEWSDRERFGGTVGAPDSLADRGVGLFQALAKAAEHPHPSEIREERSTRASLRKTREAAGAAGKGRPPEDCLSRPTKKS